MSDEYRELFLDKQESLLSVAKKLMEAHARILILEIALDESVQLQSHYAKLINQYDGGERMSFESPEQWIARLVEIGKISRPQNITANKET